MNWNGQRRWLDHAITVRQNPDTAAKLQAELNTFRRKRLNEAATVRPSFLPVQFSLTAAGQVSPYREYTTPLGYDVLITGAITDTPTRDIIVTVGESETPLTYVGDEVNLYLRADDLAGSTATVGGGQTGTFYLPTPIELSAHQRLAVQMFKTDTTASAEVANITFVGVRVYHREYAARMFDDDESRKIERSLALREIPSAKFLKVAVNFNAAGVGGVAANIYTPKVSEPLLIRGIRTTLRQSTIELGLEGEPAWTYQATPIWGVAGEDELIHENYLWFSKPVYLHSNRTVEITRVVNSIDGSLIDAQTGNTITFICETV